MPFRESEFSPYRGKGTSTIEGQAFLKTRSGDVKYGAGNAVQMVPVTTYTTEILTSLLSGKTLTPPPDPRYYAYRRETVADGSGNFEFRDVPAGSYYLSCAIVWEVPSGYGAMRSGGTAVGKVTVAHGERAKVVVTR